MKFGETSVWGLTPAQLHDRFWASRGVQVVRQGEPSEIVRRAELFLLTDSRSLAIFGLGRATELFCWIKPRLLWLRLQDRRERGYRERAIMGEDRRFLGFDRIYGAADARLARVALTRDRELARSWQASSSPRQGWQQLRTAVQRDDRHALSISGSVYDRCADRDLVEFSRQLVQVWQRPDSTIPRAARHETRVWADAEAAVNRSARFVGPVWIGAGRTIDEGSSVVGPSILWDRPERRPVVETLQWDRIVPTDSPAPLVRARRTSSLNRIAKRAFDFTFALFALLVTLPAYPLIMLAIWLEDGRPFFFVHRRETIGGREFPCIKFRSMRNDAEKMKQALASQNQADGPQFFIDQDPRLTRVGRILRDWNIDELPQFINALLGHMSVVGPRPSPRRENQFCPSWREARLSVRPGVTGLWQIMRTRQAGNDFQEWIKYDIEYVETASWRLDFWIIFQTLRVII